MTVAPLSKDPQKVSSTGLDIRYREKSFCSRTIQIVDNHAVKTGAYVRSELKTRIPEIFVQFFARLKELISRELFKRNLIQRIWTYKGLDSSEPSIQKIKIVVHPPSPEVLPKINLEPVIDHTPTKTENTETLESPVVERQNTPIQTPPTRTGRQSFTSASPIHIPIERKLKPDLGHSVKIEEVVEEINEEVKSQNTSLRSDTADYSSDVTEEYSSDEETSDRTDPVAQNPGNNIGRPVVPLLNLKKMQEFGAASSSDNSVSITNTHAVDMNTLLTGPNAAPVANQIQESIDGGLTSRGKKLYENSITIVAPPGARIPWQSNKINETGKLLCFVVPLASLPNHTAETIEHQVQDRLQDGTCDVSANKLIAHPQASKHCQAILDAIPADMRTARVYVINDTKDGITLVPMHENDAIDESDISINFETGDELPIDINLYSMVEEIYSTAQRLSLNAPWVTQIPSSTFIPWYMHPYEPNRYLYPIDTQNTFASIVINPPGGPEKIVEYGQSAFEDLVGRYRSKKGHPESEIPHIPDDCEWINAMFQGYCLLYPNMKIFWEADLVCLVDAGRALKAYLEEKKSKL